MTPAEEAEYERRRLLREERAAEVRRKAGFTDAPLRGVPSRFRHLMDEKVAQKKDEKKK